MAGNIKTTPVCVIDSSFLLSTWLPDEKISAEHKICVKDFRANKIIFRSCELLKYEIYNSLKSAVIQKRISREKANILHTAFSLMKIEYVNIDFEKTFDLSLQHDLTFYDASYLGLAKLHKCKLLTLDKKLEEISS
ncbi:MAG: type II toxin-antitoxin system VapC family toxin [bacterium]|nr:type II toxin-antitoxin system VapC family toxin [bacterium]